MKIKQKPRQRKKRQDKKIKQHVSDFMGRVFETICMQYLMRLNIKDSLPFLFTEIGRWWGGNPITKKETEIDIVALSRGQPELILGECKWQNDEMSLKVYRDLKEKAALFSERDVYYCLFSKVGFSSALIDEAKKDGKLSLVTLSDLFDV